MMEATVSFLSHPANGVMIMLVAALLIAFYRLVRGPSLPDRVVALDLIAIVVVGILSLYAITTHHPVFLDAGIVLSMVAFLGTVAFARYLEKRAHDE